VTGSTSVDDADLGYFGPDSVSWRILADPLAMAGGLRALLLQALHPEAMALLDAKTVFRDQPWDRIRRTAEFVATVTYAPTPVVDAAAARVRKVHRMLGIGDPGQMAWVHNCEVDSFLVSARLSGLGLTAAEEDRYVDEQRIAGRLVGVPEELMPSGTAELAEYFEGIRPSLRLTKEAVRGARYVVAPPMSLRMELLTPARLGWTTLSALAVGMLPRWARRMYLLPANRVGDLATAAGMRGLALTVAALPERYRLGPMARDAYDRAAALPLDGAEPLDGAQALDAVEAA
jgi:uncharacterized protein (DUF2236 family)